MKRSKTPKSLEPTQRQLRVGEEVRHVLSSVLASGSSPDPRLYDVSITITEVRMSPDLRHATAYIMPLGGQDVEEVVHALNDGKGLYRTVLAKGLNLRFTPQIRFVKDGSFEEAHHINTLLNRPEVQQDLVKREELVDPKDPTRFGDWEKNGRSIDF